MRKASNICKPLFSLTRSFTRSSTATRELPVRTTLNPTSSSLRSPLSHHSDTKKFTPALVTPGPGLLRHSYPPRPASEPHTHSPRRPHPRRLTSFPPIDPQDSLSSRLRQFAVSCLSSTRSSGLPRCLNNSVRPRDVYPPPLPSFTPATPCKTINPPKLCPHPLPLLHQST